jgi:hypothetical protein
MNTQFDAIVRRRACNGQVILPDDLESERSLPLLWSFLTRREALDEYVKETAQVSIRVGLGEWLVTLTDPTLQVSCVVSSAKLMGCLQSWEEVASSPHGVWSPWRGSEGKLRKKNTRTSSQEPHSG